MAFFAERLAESRPLIVVGARTVSLLPDLSLPADVELVTATDDGSRGHPGTVLDYLSDSERSGSLALNAETAVMYACGPWPMLGAAAQFAAERGIECFVSVEQTMGCAVGACMGCAVRVKGTEKFARVCTEGPIFRSERLVWT
jgi:dihydroorotate dehydrogenase electron transfer subunit